VRVENAALQDTHATAAATLLKLPNQNTASESSSCPSQTTATCRLRAVKAHLAPPTRYTVYAKDPKNIAQVAATRAWLDTLVYDTLAIEDRYSLYWGWEETMEEEIEKADAEGRFDQWLDENEVVDHWTGCMLDEEGARLVAANAEWIMGIDGTQHRECKM